MILSIHTPKKGATMFRKKLPAMIVLASLIIISACNLPGGQPAAGGTDQETAVPLETQVAEALASTAAAQAAIANAVAATQTALAANVPEATLTQPPAATQQEFTPTSSVPMVTVSVDTNCRSGPNTAYDLLGVMKVGEKAEVVGRSTLSDTMIIKLPSNPSITCWLWAQNATVEGDTSGLPVVPVPPTPTPKFTATPVFTATPQFSFDLDYVSTDWCIGLYRIKFRITNTGGLTWESNRVTVTDQDTIITKKVTWDNFPYYSSTCATGADQNLEAGETGYTTSDGFVIDPAGHAMAATIRVCSQDGLAGTCLEQTITFSP
jgi:hypothetical protein